MLVGLWNGKGPVCRDELVVLLALAGGESLPSQVLFKYSCPSPLALSRRD